MIPVINIPFWNAVMFLVWLPEAFVLLKEHKMHNIVKKINLIGASPSKHNIDCDNGPYVKKVCLFVHACAHVCVRVCVCVCVCVNVIPLHLLHLCFWDSCLFIYIICRIYLCDSCALGMCCIHYCFEPAKPQSHGAPWQSWGSCCSCKEALTYCCKGSSKYEHVVSNWWNMHITRTTDCQHHWILTINTRLRGRYVLYSSKQLQQSVLVRHKQEYCFCNKTYNHLGSPPMQCISSYTVTHWGYRSHQYQLVWVNKYHLRGPALVSTWPHLSVG